MICTKDIRWMKGTNKTALVGYWPWELSWDVLNPETAWWHLLHSTHPTHWLSPHFCHPKCSWNSDVHIRATVFSDRRWRWKAVAAMFWIKLVQEYGREIKTVWISSLLVSSSSGTQKRLDNQGQASVPHQNWARHLCSFFRGRTF